MTRSQHHAGPVNQGWAKTGISEVDASGTCFAEPFTLDDIMVGGPIDDAYVVTEDIPLVQQEDLFDAQSGWFKDANISIDTVLMRSTSTNSMATSIS